MPTMTRNIRHLFEYSSFISTKSSLGPRLVPHSCGMGLACSKTAKLQGAQIRAHIHFWHFWYHSVKMELQALFQEVQAWNLYHFKAEAKEFLYTLVYHNNNNILWRTLGNAKYKTFTNVPKLGYLTLSLFVHAGIYSYWYLYMLVPVFTHTLKNWRIVAWKWHNHKYIIVIIADVQDTVID